MPTPPELLAEVTKDWIDKLKLKELVKERKVVMHRKGKRKAVPGTCFETKVDVERYERKDLAVYQGLKPLKSTIGAHSMTVSHRADTTQELVLLLFGSGWFIFNRCCP